jgi:4-amino-4-deoxy-L-arabinose transferase-like glycosyltransferase
MYLKKRCDMGYALIGVLLFLSLPIIVKLSITAYVDLGLVFFSTAALMFLFKWMESAFKLKYLIISAVWCGLALGTKYNGLVLLLLLIPLVPLIYSKKMGFNAALKSSGDEKKRYPILGKAFGYATVYMIIALVIFSPWAIRNYIWINNPIYPLYDNWFNAEDTRSRLDPDSDFQNHVRDASSYINQFSNPFVARKVLFNESGWQTLMIPLRIFIQGKDDNPQYFDGRLNPYLLLLPFFAFFPKTEASTKYQTEKKVLIGFSVLFLLIVYFQRDLRVRYIAPAIPPLVILSTLGLQNLMNSLKKNKLWAGGKIWAGCVAFCVVLLIGLNMIYIGEQFQRIQPISYLSGRVGRDIYIEKYRPEHAAIQFANRQLPENAKIFCLFLGDRSYYSERELFFGDTHFYRNVKQADTAEKLKMEFQRINARYLLIRYDIFNQWSGLQFNDREKRVLGDFFKQHATLIFAKGGYGLYRL